MACLSFSSVDNDYAGIGEDLETTPARHCDAVEE